MSVRSGMLRLPGPAPGVWHGEFPEAWRPVFTTMAWADLAAQVLAMDGPVGKQIGYPPYFEEVGHVVDAADPLLSDPQVVAVLREVHAALGVTDAMTHTELKLTPAGPKVIEVNGRLGGDLIPYLGLLATGIDPGLAAAAVACGRRPELAGGRRRAAGIRFFYPERDGTTIGEIGFDRARLPESVDLAEPLVQPGAVVSPPPAGTLFGRIALATAVADTPQQCQDALAAAGAALRVRPATVGG